MKEAVETQQGRWSPTLDRSLPSLPLRSVALKRDSSVSLDVGPTPSQ